MVVVRVAVVNGTVVVVLALFVMVAVDVTVVVLAMKVLQYAEALLALSCWASELKTAHCCSLRSMCLRGARSLIETGLAMAGAARASRAAPVADVANFILLLP